MTITTPTLRVDDDRALALLGIPADVAEPLREYVHALNRAQARQAVEKFPHLIRGWYDLAPGQRPAVPTGELAKWFDVDPAATSAGKYIRVVGMRHPHQYDRGHDGRPIASSVHAFLVKATGELAKPAGWAGPAKSTSKDPVKRGRILTRYTLSDPASLAALIGRIDGDAGTVHGDYLYQP